MQLWVTAQPLEHETFLVNIHALTCAPIKMGLALDAALQYMAQHGLHRCKAGAASDHQERSIAVAIHKLTYGSFDPQQRAYLQRRKQQLAEAAAHHPPHVQLDQLVVMRRVGDGKAAAAAIFEQ